MRTGSEPKRKGPTARMGPVFTAVTTGSGVLFLYSLSLHGLPNDIETGLPLFDCRVQRAEDAKADLLAGVPAHILKNGCASSKLGPADWLPAGVALT